jgi:hypothetical protein
MEHAREALRLDFWSPGDDRDAVDEEMSVGFAGMFERNTLGSRLLEAVGRPRLANSRSTLGLKQLGLRWSDLLEPDAGEAAASLLPLETVLRKLAALPDPATRAAAVKALVGDLGIESIEDLSRALAGPVDPERDAARRTALSKVDLTPETVAQKPLESLAKVVRAIEAAASFEDRRQLAAAFFGPAGRRVEQLGKDVAIARSLAVLEDIQAPLREIEDGDALAAFAAAQKFIESAPETDAARRKQLLQGLFGPRGPALYAAAGAVNEGVDHAWVFRYER